MSAEPHLIIDESKKPQYLLLLAHGAGAGMTHTFMEAIAKNIASKNGRVVRFNFPYIDQGRKSPGSPKSAIEAIDYMISEYSEKYSNLPLFVAGKSYGGRMASHWVAEHPNTSISGLAYLGFPLHAPGKISTDRANHLSEIQIPQLFIQGTKDKLATYDKMKKVIDSLRNARLYTVQEGDHSFKVPKRTGKTHDQIMEELAGVIDRWALDQLK